MLFNISWNSRLRPGSRRTAGPHPSLITPNSSRSFSPQWPRHQSWAGLAVSQFGPSCQHLINTGMERGRAWYTDPTTQTAALLLAQTFLRKNWGYLDTCWAEHSCFWEDAMDHVLSYSSFILTKSSYKQTQCVEPKSKPSSSAVKWFFKQLFAFYSLFKNIILIIWLSKLSCMLYLTKLLSFTCVLCLTVKIWFDQQWILDSGIYRQSPRAAAFSGATCGTTCVDSSQTRAPYSGQLMEMHSLNSAYICQGKCWVMFLWATLISSLTIKNIFNC